MSEKDPFAETDDTERTVIRPNPGGRRKAASSEAGNVKQQTADASALVPSPAHAYPL